MAGILAGVLRSPRHPGPPGAPFGIIVWVIDTCRADRLGIYDPARQTTPFLDRLAGESVVFERCYAQASWTKPAMAAMLSGRHPSAVNVHGLYDRLDDGIVTSPEALGAAGYHTAGFSANPIVGALSNYTQGFDEFVEAVDVLPGKSVERYAGGSAAALLERVVPWLSANAGRPFFLLIHSMDPHEEYRPAPRFLERFADPNDEPRYRREWVALKRAQPQQLSNHCTAATFARAGVDPAWFINYGRQLYDADILATDTAIAALWAHLTSLGLADRVVLVVTADHGEEFMDHGGTSHGFSLYDELLHVPLLIRAPGQLPGGRRVAQPMRAIDLYPTLLDLAGLPRPPDLEGDSLVGLAIGGAAERRDPLIFAEKREVSYPGFDLYRIGAATSVIAWPWKLIENSQSPVGREFPPRELYRLDDDPRETHNLVDSDPLRVAELTAILQRHAGSAAPSVAVDIQHPPPETIERLRQLGYAE